MGNEIAIKKTANNLAMYENMADPMAAVEKLGDWMLKSGMFGLTKPEQAYMLAWAAISERRNPLDLSREFHIVEGKLSKRADAAIAEFISRGGVRRIKWLKWDEVEAKAEFIDCHGQPYTFSYTYAEAKEAGFIYIKGTTNLKANWKRTPANMIRARLISNSIRMIEPDIMVGIYTPEEISDGGFDNDDQGNGDTGSGSSFLNKGNPGKVVEEEIPEAEVVEPETTEPKTAQEPVLPLEPTTPKLAIADAKTEVAKYAKKEKISEATLAAFAQQKDWVASDGTWKDVSDTTWDMIADNYDKFIEALAGWIDKTQKK